MDDIDVTYLSEDETRQLLSDLSSRPVPPIRVQVPSDVHSITIAGKTIDLRDATPADDDGEG